MIVGFKSCSLWVKYKGFLVVNGKSPSLFLHLQRKAAKKEIVSEIEIHLFC